MSGAKVYTVNGASAGSANSLPDWLTRKRAQKSKGRRGAVKEEIAGAINVIQDFEFPEASNRIRVTADGHHALATGTYKPQVKCFDLEQLTQKWERHSDAENVDFVILSEDWTKSVHLQNDRTLELHTQSNSHYKTRIPRFGRAVGYHFPSCDVLVGAAGADIYRLNLDQGRFMTPLTLASEGCNALDVNPAHNLFTFGMEDGTVEFWDPRAKDRLATLQLDSACTALASRSDGLSLAVGTHNGFALVYDLRSTRPLARKDQGYGLPVHRISWLERAPGAGSGALVASADKKVLKIWDRDAPATNFASVTPETDINDIHHLPGTGMMLTANEGMPMHAYYVPSLGPAPRWCSFLDSLTEELEEGAQATRGQYEDFKFLDRAELERLGLDTLIGTPALRPYMHGFFVKLALYDAARVIANPYVYEEARAKAVQEKVDKLADSRIRAKKGNQPKVNAALAERVRKDEERASKKRKRNAVETEVGDVAGADHEVAGHAKTSLLADPRFKAVFENPDFAVDEEHREWQLLNPSSTAQKRRRLAGGDVSESSEDEDDEDDEAEAPRSGLFDTDSEPSGSAGESDDEEPEQPPPQKQRPISSAPRLVSMQADRGGAGGTRADRNADFGQRRVQPNAKGKQRDFPTAKFGDESVVITGREDGPRDITWTPSVSSAKKHKHSEALSDSATSNAKEKGTSKRERFGAGMERGGQEEDARALLKEEERRGRTHRRTGIRSGSRNTFRKL